MVILHIAALNNSPFTGVCVAAPQHVIAQKKYAVTGIINIKNVKIDAFDVYPGTQIDYMKPFDINQLPSPFNKPDIVVFHECYRIEYLQIAKNLLKNQIPYIILPHGELNKNAQKKKRLKKMAANLLLFNRFINHATAVQCLSEEEKNNTYFGKRKLMISNGVHMPEKQKAEFHENKVVFLYIGRLEVLVKGLDILTGAAALARDELKAANATIDIYGPDYQGRYAQVQELIKQNHVEDLVFLHHEVMGKEKENLLLDADVFIQTSRFEGMPLGVLEACSYGLPCLVTEGTNLGKKLVENSAGWCSQNDSYSVAEAIAKCLSEKEKYAAYGHNGCAYVYKVFSWDVIAKQTIDEYKKVLKS